MQPFDQAYHRRTSPATSLPGLQKGELLRRGSNDVFLVSDDLLVNASILRIMPNQPHPLQNIASEKRLIDLLRKYGMSCPAMSYPIALSRNQLCGYDEDRSGVIFPRILGHSLREFSADFYSWGLEVGKLHSIVTRLDFPQVPRETMNGKLLTEMLSFVLENGNLTRDQRVEIIRYGSAIPQLADELFVEEKPIMCHGDLGPSNVLISEGGRAILIDFDFSCIAPRSYDFAVWSELFSLEFPCSKDAHEALSKSFWDGYRVLHPNFSPEPELINRWTRVFRFLAIHYIVWSEVCRFPAENYVKSLDAALVSLAAASFSG